MTNFAESLVRLSSACWFEYSEEALVVHTRENIVRICCSEHKALASLLVKLQSIGVPALHGAGVLNADVLDTVLKALDEEGLVLQVRKVEDAERGDLSEALSSEARFYARMIFEQPFWIKLLAGRLSQAQVIGWGIEFYHFVEAANTYMPLGIAHARGHRGVIKELAKHYVEEMDHGQIFLDGLSECGLDSISIQNSPPLPHTAALINLLSELAIEGEVTYSASFAVMQPGLSQATHASVNSFYADLSSLYPTAAPMFNAFRRHALLDVDLGHEDNALRKLCEKPEGLSLSERDRASWAIRAVSEAFIQFFEGILNYYTMSSQPFARRPLLVERI